MNPHLTPIREAHVARCAAALVRIDARQGYGEPAGLPNSLIDAGCWLVANGWEGEPSPAEKTLGWGPDKYRLFMRAAGERVARDAVEAGYRALFTARHAIFPIPQIQKAA